MTDVVAHFYMNVALLFKEAAPLCHILNENNELKEMASVSRISHVGEPTCCLSTPSSPGAFRDVFDPNVLVRRC